MGCDVATTKWVLFMLSLGAVGGPAIPLATLLLMATMRLPPPAPELTIMLPCGMEDGAPAEDATGGGPDVGPPD